MPKMRVNPEETKAPKPVPTGWYELRLKGLTAKLSKSGKGYNYQAYMNIINNKAEFNDSFVMFQINNGFNQAKHSNDFVHGLGLELETDGSFPGDWVVKKPEMNPDDPSYFDGAQYAGPLLGRTLEAEVITTAFDGVERNSLKQVRCKVQDCSTKYPDIRHLTDLIGKRG